jgi:hypothetical protein
MGLHQATLRLSKVSVSETGTDRRYNHLMANNSRYNEHSCLCPEHAQAFNITLKPEQTAKNLSELAEDEFIECDACNIMVMRRSGAI